MATLKTADTITIEAPRFEHHHSGLGVETTAPRISWRFNHASMPAEDWQQAVYELEITIQNGTSEVYRVVSSESICVPWPAQPLQQRQQAKVRVRCQRDTQIESALWTEWSASSIVESTLLHTNAWEAQLIGASQQLKNEDTSLRPIRLLKSFTTRSDTIRRARLYITAHGCYKARINGHVIGDHFMAPGWQSYKHRLHCQTFDVAEHLTSNNSLDVEVAAGWFASKLAWAKGRRNFYGDELGLLAQLMIDYNDGSTEVIKSDATWQSGESPIISSEIQNGETYQQSLDVELTSQNAKLSAVKVLPMPTAKLIFPNAPPVRVTQAVQIQRIFKSPSGLTLLDFGQNLVGCLLIHSLRKSPGTEVRFSHAEVLENGELGRRPLRGATSTDTVICDGNELKDWSPKFTFHGFRYVEVTGWSPEDKECPLTIASISAQVIHSDMQRTGTFECSNQLVNKLHENATWSMRGNFLSVPTDCPQRDERLGWTGDIQVFGPSAGFLYDTTGMLGKWLDDLSVEQAERGGVPPFVVPDVITRRDAIDTDFWPHMPNAVWDDVAVLLPWSLYTASGDLHMLDKQYTSMQAWLDQGIQRGEDGLWDANLYQLGDWLDPIAPPSEPGNGRTDGVLVADMYLIQITKKIAETASLLAKPDDAARYAADYKRLLEVFRYKYVSRSGLVVADTQTTLALMIMFDLFESSEQREVAGKRLARSIRLQQFRVATGFAGTPIILHALSRTGHSQLAYRMLLEGQCPSWMYAISMGATTIWERWDSMLPDGSINPGEMTSFNHYALGSVVNWLHEVVAGLSPLEPGYKVIQIKPVPGGDITSAKVELLSPYGKIRCQWHLDGDSFSLDVTIPPNTTAVVIMPGEEVKKRIGAGQHVFTSTVTLQLWPPEAIMPPFWPQPAPLLAKHMDQLTNAEQEIVPGET